MKVELNWQRKTKKKLFQRYYADGGSEPDYIIHVTNREPGFVLKRLKDVRGEFSKDVQISYDELPAAVKEYISSHTDKKSI